MGADVAYGLGFIVASMAAFLRSGLSHPRQLLLLAMVAVWGLRLAIHILVRNWGREDTILFLLLKVSGIPMLEAKFRGNPEFEDYLARTSAFFPWFPSGRGAGR